jgi:hypothetical protein
MLFYLPKLRQDATYGERRLDQVKRKTATNSHTYLIACLSCEMMGILPLHALYVNCGLHVRFLAVPKSPTALSIINRVISCYHISQ